MKKLFLSCLFSIIAIAISPPFVSAQIDEQCPHIRPMTQRRIGIDDSKAVREQLIKLCINENKKEFEELIARSEEIEKLSAEIKSSFEENKTLSDEDYEKLDQLEKLVKKVRSDLKASDDDEEDEKPKDLVDAIMLLNETATNLASEIKKTTRHSVSLVAVQTSNSFMRLVKFLRIRN